MADPGSAITGRRGGAGDAATFEAARLAALDIFAAAILSGDLSLMADHEGGLDLTADDWTLHLASWPGPREAWVAADDEPEDPDPATARALLLDSLDPASLSGLAAFDARLGGRVTLGLRETGDPLSVALAALIRATDEGDATLAGPAKE